MPFQLSPAISFQTTPQSLASFTSAIGAGFSSISFLRILLRFFMFFSINKIPLNLWNNLKHMSNTMKYHKFKTWALALASFASTFPTFTFAFRSTHGSLEAVTFPPPGLKINAAGWKILSIEPWSPKLRRLVTSQHTVSHFTPGQTKACSLLVIPDLPLDTSLALKTLSTALLTQQ